MIKKHAILIGVVVALLFLSVAAFYYPGGSQNNPNSTAYDWKKNYLCNLFSAKAINGSDNPARILAIIGMFFLCVSMALFFVRFSTKISARKSANIIKYCGVASEVFAFFAVTSYHDIAITIASVCALISLFYITVFILKSKLFLFKLLSILCLLILYCNNYIYYTQNLLYTLPVMQKVSFLLIIVWMLGLEYFTTKADFDIVKIQKK